MLRDWFADTIPQTVAVESTTARVVPEPMALEKGIEERRQTRVKDVKTTEENELVFIQGLDW